MQRIREVGSHRQHLTKCSNPGSPWLRAARDHDPATWPVGQDYFSKTLLLFVCLSFLLVSPHSNILRKAWDRKNIINLKYICVVASPIGGDLNSATRPDQRWHGGYPRKFQNVLSVALLGVQRRCCSPLGQISNVGRTYNPTTPRNISYVSYAIIWNGDDSSFFSFKKERRLSLTTSG